MADVGLDFRQREGIGLAGETDRVTAGARTRRTADAMHVVGSFLRQIVIDHMADIRHMQAS